MPLILNQEQAEAVYSAMCSLKNVGGRVEAHLKHSTVYVREYVDGRVQVTDGYKHEFHGSQSAFAAAYGVSTGL